MFEDRIARGAAWLDKNKPGWELLIDVSQLELEDCEKCVLGQVFLQEAIARRLRTGWSYGLYELESESGPNVAKDLGFTCCDVMTEDCGSEEKRQAMWTALTDEWGALIKDRLNKGIQV